MLMIQASHGSLTGMNFPPMVAPHLPQTMPQGMPSGVAYGAPIAVAGAQMHSALSCPPGVLGCGPQETMPQLSDGVAAWPTWVKVLAGLSAAAVLVLLVTKLVDRYH